MVKNSHFQAPTKLLYKLDFCLGWSCSYEILQHKWNFALIIFFQKIGRCTAVASGGLIWTKFTKSWMTLNIEPQDKTSASARQPYNIWLSYIKMNGNICTQKFHQKRFYHTYINNISWFIRSDLCARAHRPHVRIRTLRSLRARPKRPSGTGC
jgi:hypothetical protein